MNVPSTPKQSASAVKAADGRLEVGKLAYAEARHAYELVGTQFTNGMNRIVQILTFSVASISFLAGQVLGSNLSGTARAASIGSGLLTGVFCVYTILALMPAKNWSRGIEGTRIVELYIDADVGAGNAPGAYEKVAKLISEDANDNQQKTDALLRKVPIVGALAAASFCSWLVIAIATSG